MEEYEMLFKEKRVSFWETQGFVPTNKDLLDYIEFGGGMNEI